MLVVRRVTATSLINVERDVRSGRLQAVLPDWRIQPTEVYIATTSRLVPGKARGFIDHVVQHLGRATSATAPTQGLATPNTTWAL